jgi:hypothetical protein
MCLEAREALRRGVGAGVIARPALFQRLGSAEVGLRHAIDCGEDAAWVELRENLLRLSVEFVRIAATLPVDRIRPVGLTSQYLR